VIILIFDLVTQRKCEDLSLIAKIAKILKTGLCAFRKFRAGYKTAELLTVDYSTFVVRSTFF